jgi:UPF0716 protein FxsA
VRKLRWVPLILLVLLGVEFAIFWWVGGEIGFGWALLLIAVLSLCGAYLLKREGVRAWRRVRAAAQATTPAGTEVLDGAVGLAAALLLLVPGFLTAAIGLLLLIGPIRRAARGGARRLTERRVNSRVAGDLFGPRQVKVQRGRRTGTPADSGQRPTATGPTAPDGGQPTPPSGRPDDRTGGGRPPGGSAAGPPGGGSGEVIEGEIVD